MVLAAILGMTGSAVMASEVQPPVQNPDCGRIERMNVVSPQMGETIIIDTWLPEEYDEMKDQRFPVIYMHDGQNLYDSNTTWNHQSWEMDSVMCSLISENLIEPAIIVGVHSSPQKRVADLMPQKAVSGTALEETLEQVKLKGREPRGDAYAAFLVETLKPEIDKKYRTLTDMKNTSVMGSSMGGLMSIYALCEYPEVFGNALCLSTHWIGSPAVAKQFADAMYEYIDKNLPQGEAVDSPKCHRLYFDHGTETIDAYYAPAETRILKLIKSKGYGPGTLLNMVDPGAPHEENAWAARVAIPLRYLLGKRH